MSTGFPPQPRPPSHLDQQQQQNNNIDHGNNNNSNNSNINLSSSTGAVPPLGQRSRSSTLRKGTKPLPALPPGVSALISPRPNYSPPPTPPSPSSPIVNNNNNHINNNNSNPTSPNVNTTTSNAFKVNLINSTIMMGGKSVNTSTNTNRQISSPKESSTSPRQIIISSPRENTSSVPVHNTNHTPPASSPRQGSPVVTTTPTTPIITTGSDSNPNSNLHNESSNSNTNVRTFRSPSLPTGVTTTNNHASSESEGLIQSSMEVKTPVLDDEANQAKLEYIASRLDDFPGEVIIEGRRYVYEGMMEKLNPHHILQDRYFFLFSDILVSTKLKTENRCIRYLVKAVIPLQNTLLRTFDPVSFQAQPSRLNQIASTALNENPIRAGLKNVGNLYNSDNTNSSKQSSKVFDCGFELVRMDVQKIYRLFVPTNRIRTIWLGHLQRLIDAHLNAAKEKQAIRDVKEKEFLQKFEAFQVESVKTQFEEKKKRLLLPTNHSSSSQTHLPSSPTSSSENNTTSSNRRPSTEDEIQKRIRELTELSAQQDHTTEIKRSENLKLKNENFELKRQLAASTPEEPLLLLKNILERISLHSSSSNNDTISAQTLEIEAVLRDLGSGGANKVLKERRSVYTVYPVTALKLFTNNNNNNNNNNNDQKSIETATVDSNSTNNNNNNTSHSNNVQIVDLSLLDPEIEGPDNGEDSENGYVGMPSFESLTNIGYPEEQPLTEDYSSSDEEEVDDDIIPSPTISTPSSSSTSSSTPATTTYSTPPPTPVSTGVNRIISLNRNRVTESSDSNFTTPSASVPCEQEDNIEEMVKERRKVSRVSCSDILKMGYMTKKSGSPLGRFNWRNRFFILHPTFLDFYLSSDQAMNVEPKGSIGLKGATVEILVSTNRPHTLQLKSSRNKIYLLECASVEDMRSWLTSMRRAIRIAADDTKYPTESIYISTASGSNSTRK